MLGDLKAVLGAIAGLLLGAAVVLLYTSLVTLPSERAASFAAGKAESDAAWRELQRLAAAQREAERAATQTTINKIETDYHQREAERTAQMTALDQALQEEQANAPLPMPGAPCRAVVSRRVLNGLRGVGASAPRIPAAVPAARVP